MTSRKLLVLVSILLVIACDAIAGRPDFFARPVVQYTWLPSEYRKSYTYYDGRVSGTTGPAYSANSFASSSSGFGGGLSAGIIWGKNNSFEFGGEGTITRFTGSYVITQTAPVNTGSTTHPCTFKVSSLLASFRHFLREKDAKIRPYYGVVLGESWIDVTSPANPPSGGAYSYSTKETENLSAGVGLGVVYQFGHGTQLEVGYRLMGSWQISFSSSSHFYNESHTLNFALRQHF
jgi:hypothetical protein